MKRLEVAERCWVDSQMQPSKLELLATPEQPLDALHAGFVEACLMDLQIAMDCAWEDGEVGAVGMQLAFAWERFDVPTKKAA